MTRDELKQLADASDPDGQVEVPTADLEALKREAARKPTIRRLFPERQKTS